MGLRKYHYAKIEYSNTQGLAECLLCPESKDATSNIDADSYEYALKNENANMKTENTDLKTENIDQK